MEHIAEPTPVEMKGYARAFCAEPKAERVFAAGVYHYLYPGRWGVRHNINMSVPKLIPRNSTHQPEWGRTGPRPEIQRTNNETVGPTSFFRRDRRLIKSALRSLAAGKSILVLDSKINEISLRKCSAAPRSTKKPKTKRERENLNSNQQRRAY